jgi:arginyl-tRNA synthetase
MRITQVQKNLTDAIKHSLHARAKQTPPPNGLPRPLTVELEIPKDSKHGDLTTNIAMRMAKPFCTNPVQLAHLVKEELQKNTDREQITAIIDKIEVSPPGFINFWFTKEYLYGILAEIGKDREHFGRNTIGREERVNIEFVSANPTGPLTIAHGRQAAVGDALARIMDFSGYRVTKEYFINDVGTQIELLGKSIHARYLSLHGTETPVPKDGYHGTYIQEIANEVTAEHKERFAEKTDANSERLSGIGVEKILGTIREDLARFGVHFDRWSSQRKITRQRVERVLKDLGKKGYIYEKDGATWFMSTAFGDDKDRVVIKSDGQLTYLAPDIAYHLSKYKRGFQKIIDIWGPDHHGYIPRLTASVEALGYDRKSISVLIVQLATLFRNGTALSMSTRKGGFITLREVIDEVGCDVAKFFFLMRKLDSHLDFDLEIAKKDSMDNPVYYIQYAHARIASILNFSGKVAEKLKGTRYVSGYLREREELLLLRMLCQFPLAVERSARTLEPYRIVEYLNEMAKIFHNFYTKHRVVTEDDLLVTKARLCLVKGVKSVLANGLRLLGISFPERM